MSGAVRVPESLLQRMARLSLRTSCRALAARQLRLTVEGAHHLPPAGPVLLAARHYHHLYDACALLSVVERPLYFFVALDWVSGSAGRGVMEWACRTARWPVVLRPERPPPPVPTQHSAPVSALGTQHSALSTQHSSQHSSERRRYLRQGTDDAEALLHAGQALVVFPEGYPNVDPTYTPKQGDEFLAFQAGFAHLVERAERVLDTPVPVLPVGVFYQRAQRWQVVVRFGPPLWRLAAPTRATFVATVEAECRALSMARGTPSPRPSPARGGADDAVLTPSPRRGGGWGEGSPR